MAAKIKGSTVKLLIWVNCDCNDMAEIILRTEINIELKFLQYD